jgi:HTH-type transcriptional regulator / antitoxin HipB
LAGSALLKEASLPPPEAALTNGERPFLPTRRSKAALHETVFPNGNELRFAGYLSRNLPVREHFHQKDVPALIIFPYGILLRVAMRTTVEQIGALIRATRKGLGVTQRELALTSGTGLRFVVDLERGKETCEIGKALTILQTLGIKLTLVPPSAAGKGE